MEGLKVKSVTLNNLRGFTNTTLATEKKKLVIVGPNNSGKTSAFRILDWLFNTFIPQKDANTPLTPSDVSLLLPARNTRNQARRLTLTIGFKDKPKIKGLNITASKEIKLRVNIRLNPSPNAYLALNDPTRTEQNVSIAAAVQLFSMLKEQNQFVHVPAVRDSHSERFSNAFQLIVGTALSERAMHNTQGGAGKSYRKIKNNFDEASNEVDQVTSDIWEELLKDIPSSLPGSGKVHFGCGYEDFLNFIQSRLELRISTGEHDSHKVNLSELGSGLQSLLDLALYLRVAKRSERTQWLMIDEPEAFLHPSAQRTLARELLSAASDSVKICLSTHSPIVLEESQFQDILICRNQKYYTPKVSDPRRESINASLINGFGAEMLFSDSVLLVEGPGDQLFFESLRRRLAEIDKIGFVDRCFVIPTTSCTFFAPWLKLLTSYGDSADRPIRFLAAPDGDSPSEIRRAFSDVPMKIPNTVGKALTDLSEAIRNKENWIEVTLASNDICRSDNFPLVMLQVDLECAMLNNASDEFIGLVTSFCSFEGNPTKAQVMKNLGSKVGDRKTDPLKAPYVREYIGKNIPASDITENVIDILTRWLAGAANRNEVKSLLDEFLGR